MLVENRAGGGAELATTKLVVSFTVLNLAPWNRSSLNTCSVKIFAAICSKQIKSIVFIFG